MYNFRLIFIETNCASAYRIRSDCGSGLRNLNEYGTKVAVTGIE